MSDTSRRPHIDPKPPAGVQPPEIPREKRPDDLDADLHERDGELPDMPLSRDPLLNPGPTPD